MTEFAKPAAKLAADPPNAVAPTGGMGLVLDEYGLIPASTIRVPVLAADPSSPLDGQVWIRSDTNQFSARISGATKRVTLT